jgi:hypothetical protein
MDAATYIGSQLKSLKENNKTLPDGVGVSDFIIKTVLSKKFRKYSVDEDFRNHLKKVVERCVAENLPIPFVWDFGGYKLWRLEETPEVDWAELFTLVYFVNWLLPIASIYKPGVTFDFYSEDIFVPQINNVTSEDTKAYIKSFNNLLKFLEKYLPKNFKYSLTRLIDQYSTKEEFDKEFDENLIRLKNELPEGLPTLTPQQENTVKLNVNLKEGQDSDPKWKEKVQLIHDAYSLASKRRPYYRNEFKILVNNTATKCAIAPGTARSSVVKFWVGAGILEKRGDTYIEHIYTPHQLEELSLSTEPISISGLDGKNFRRIKITNTQV